MNSSDTFNQGYLPIAAPAAFKADYLRLVMQQGGETASSYKQRSYQLLEVGTGMHVLDVGCGIGIDLYGGSFCQDTKKGKVKVSCS